MDSYSAKYITQRISLSPSPFLERYDLNKRYVSSLNNDNLLQNFYLEAGLKSWNNKPENIHWGWEAPECQLRGHFPGHWLSAAARIYAQTGDLDIKSKADAFVSELARCQKENGGEWAGPIPIQYLEWIARGKHVWAPHYTLHKTLMGLVDMVVHTQNAQALEVAHNWASWFHRWCGKFTREEMDDILDFETGGMLEVWAELYGLTKDSKYLDLMRSYDRPRLFDKLLAGEDVLTNRHANTTIPEIHGAARAFEVTGDERYRQIVLNYWRQAVDERGYFCTGGQTSAEVWTPKQVLGVRLSPTNQEHCVVYNMIRLADFLFRWTGDIKYADYIERNIYNGLFAQQNRKTGMVIYYMPLHANARKQWGSETNDFWCCHGSLVQAHTLYADLAFYKNSEEIVLSQYIPGKFKCDMNGAAVEVSQKTIKLWNSEYPDGKNTFSIEVNATESIRFTLSLRVPWWAANEPIIHMNGERIQGVASRPGFISIERMWQRDTVTIEIPRSITICSLPDMPDMGAFMDGPVVLAGLCEEEKTICRNGKHENDILRPFNQNAWDDRSFYTTGQLTNIQFIPLYHVTDEKYTVYFPIV